MKFVLSTLHCAGLGFALRLKEEGHDVVLAAAGTEGRNFIVARDDTLFCEKCERFGYNAHPNLLWRLNRASQIGRAHV